MKDLTEKKIEKADADLPKQKRFWKKVYDFFEEDIDGEEEAEKSQEEVIEELIESREEKTKIKKEKLLDDVDFYSCGDFLVLEREDDSLEAEDLMVLKEKGWELVNHTTHVYYNYTPRHHYIFKKIGQSGNG